MAGNYLFVYGTLLKDSNHDMAQFLEAHSECLGDAYFYGKLYMVSWYPGAVLSENTSEKVYGRIFKLNNAPEILEVLDNYEGIGTQYREPHLYRKEHTMAYLESGEKLTVGVYLYNLALDGLPRIKSGDFLKYISKA